MMAPMSSAMASDRRKTFKGLPILLPSRDMTPTANAISVAIGIPHPEEASPLELNATYTRAERPSHRLQLLQVELRLWDPLVDR